VKRPHTSLNGAAQNIEGNHPPIVSARKLESNRENARKSTGPKTARGKANSRFNALKHGLCAKRLTVSSQGKLLDADLLKLVETLQEQYGSDDIRIQLLCDAIATEYWRQGQGLRLEVKFLNEGDIHFSNKGGMALLHRYFSGSQRAQLKNLELLSELHSQLPSTKQPTVRKGTEGDGAAGGEKALKIVGVNGPTHRPKSSTRGSGLAAPADRNAEASATADSKKLA
jgi:hypothetical protein